MDSGQAFCGVAMAVILPGAVIAIVLMKMHGIA